MDFKRILQHLAVVMFVLSTASGMSYALFRYKIPGVPRFFRQWSYGMMAPYQQYRTFNEQLTARGKVGDIWKAIDLAPYFPYVRGERAMRSYLVTFRKRGDTVWPRKYKEYAELIRLMEGRDGRQWEEVSLHIEHWPMSPAGYEYLRHDPFIEYKTITHDPLPPLHEG